MSLYELSNVLDKQPTKERLSQEELKEIKKFLMLNGFFNNTIYQKLTNMIKED